MSPATQSLRAEDPTGDVGQRLDRWLAAHLPELSRSRLQKLIRQGHVRCNDQPCTDQNYLTQLGDAFTITLPDPEPIGLVPEAIPLDILYEDTHLLVINKAAGMVMHPGAGHASGTLVHALLAHCQQGGGELSGIGGEQRPGIVHRLDKDTSGVLVVAKTDQAHHHLQAQIQAKTARRRYLGVVFGQPRTEAGTITTHLGRHPGDRQKMAVVEPPKGRHAVTHWQVLESLGNYSLLQFDLETGRTHQIRVHSAHLGHPIVGDPVYTHSRKSPVKLVGQALHAWQLHFLHPVTQVEHQYTAPPPPDFERLLRQLRQQAAQR